MKLEKVSASQIAMYQECPTKWYRAYVLKDRMPASPAQAKGTAMHKLAEEYARQGTMELSGDPELISRVAPIMEYLPKPAELKEWKVEREIWLDTYEGGPKIHGFVDLESPNMYLYGPDQRAYRRIIDYKSTSDFRYAKTGEDLANNTQMMIYAKSAVNEGAGEVDLAHLYMRTRNSPAALYVSVLVGDVDVDLFFEGLILVIKDMVALAAKEPEINSIEKQVNACDNYGGCYYKPKCFAVGGVKGLFSKEPIQMPTLQEKWAAAKAARESQSSTNSPSTETESKLSGAQEDAGVESAAPLADDSPTPALPTSIISPDAAPRIPQTIIHADAPLIIREPVADKPKRTRKAKTDVVSDKSDGFSIYLDCFPCKGSQRDEVVLFEDWIAPYAQRVAEDNGVEDYRMIDFGKGKVALANLVRKHITDVPKVLVVSSYAPGANETLDVLIPYASQLVRKI